MYLPEIKFVDADEAMKSRVKEEWGEKAARFMHLEAGFSILALQGNDLIGLISMYWKTLPAPLPETCEGYIDILDIHKNFSTMMNCYKYVRQPPFQWDRT